VAGVETNASTRRGATEGSLLGHSGLGEIDRIAGLKPKQTEGRFHLARKLFVNSFIYNYLHGKIRLDHKSSKQPVWLQSHNIGPWECGSVTTP
jgi:hypothetical protein